MSTKQASQAHRRGLVIGRAHKGSDRTLKTPSRSSMAMMHWSVPQRLCAASTRFSVETGGLSKGWAWWEVSVCLHLIFVFPSSYAGAPHHRHLRRGTGMMVCSKVRGPGQKPNLWAAWSCAFSLPDTELYNQPLLYSAQL